MTPATAVPAPPVLTRHTSLVEIFSAIQGEGLNVGTRQIFVRFGGCDLRCQFCDSAQTWKVEQACTIEATPGGRDFETYANPVSLAQVLAWVDRQNHPRLHDSISITGGEPLLHTAFLQEFLPQVKQRTGLPLYLETGGHRPDRLPDVLPHFDSVGMDIKLPSASGETLWTAHADFLRLCVQAQRSGGATVFIKVIVTAVTPDAEIDQLGQLVAAIDSSVPLFLQPVTPLASGLRDRNQRDRRDPYQHQLAPSPDQVIRWQTQLKQQLDQVRVVPQTHKMLNQL